MGWDEWEKIKADVVAREGAPTRLNQLSPSGGVGAGPDLASSPAVKKAAAKAIADDLEPGVVRDGKHAAQSVDATVKEFGARDGEGWDTSGALKKAYETWEDHVAMLLGRLTSEKHALSRTGIDLRSHDVDIATRLARESRINGI
ncbi:hypothetical protein ACFV0R_28175 [Streptomyces sp. NPDC059578]|uniref:hypothetical protein n=1 Tax=Streptomyces sp. NPDC059578 TaxID=3346874 RepID=UPI00367E844B